MRDADAGRLAGRCLYGLLLALLVLLPALAEEKSHPSAVGPVLKLYQSGRLPPARQPPVVEMICSRGNEYDLRVVYDQLLLPEGMDADLRGKALGWLNDAARLRRVKPDGNLSGLSSLLESPDASIRTAAVELAATWQVAEVAPVLERIVRDADSSDALRRIAIQGLIALQKDAAEPSLVELAKSGPSLVTRMHAIAALSSVNLPVAAQWAAAVILELPPQQDLGPLLNAFFERKEGPEYLAKAIQSNPPDADTAKRVIRHMFAIGRSDDELSTVLSDAAGVSPDPRIPTPEEVAALSREAMEFGDAARGERVFRRNDLNCFRCHALQGAGGQVGPDLSPVGGSSPMDYVVNSILNPDIAVKEQYVTRIFETADGRVLTGVVIDRDDARVRLRDAQGDSLVIPTADIEFEAEGRSMMPEGLTKFLTRNELLDLIRFVSELGKPGPYGPRSSPILQRWQILNEPPEELIDDVPHLEHLRQHVFDTATEAWSPVYSLFSGVVPLNELRDADEPAIVVLRGEIQIHEGGLLGVSVESSEPCQVWINGQLMAAGEITELPIEAGRHFVTARVEISERAEPGIRVEFHRPEGSQVQFEMVGGP
jgi:putative heme-binding domain-containing protein